MQSKCLNNTQRNSYVLVFISVSNCLMYKFYNKCFQYYKIRSINIWARGTLKSIVFVQIMAYLISINSQWWNESNHCVITTTTLSIYIKKRRYGHSKQTITHFASQNDVLLRHSSIKVNRLIACIADDIGFNWNCWITIQMVLYYLSNKSKSTIHQIWTNIFSISN